MEGRFYQHLNGTWFLRRIKVEGFWTIGYLKKQYRRVCFIVLDSQNLLSLIKKCQDLRVQVLLPQSSKSKRPRTDEP